MLKFLSRAFVNKFLQKKKKEEFLNKLYIEIIIASNPLHKNVKSKVYPNRKLSLFACTVFYVN